MMAYLTRRLGFYLIAFWAAITVNFLLPRLLPGNPIDYFMGRYQSQLAANPHLLDSLRPAFDFKHRSLLAEYWQYLQHLVRFDFGVSYSQFPTPVNTLVGQALPWSILLAGTSAVLAFGIGTMIGIVAAWRRGKTV